MVLDESSKQIIDFFGSSQHSVVIVAPYIKTSALNRILGAVPKTVSQLEFVTRWDIHDIASGVCDLEIFEHIVDRGATLRIFPHLHAKYYRVDDRCVVGSANLTARGFGWVVPANVELIVALPANHEGLHSWESRLLQSSIIVDDEICNTIKKEVEKLKVSDNALHYPELPFPHENGDVEIDLEHWLPSCPAPDRLWEVYGGGGEGVMVQFAYEAAQRDLAVLGPPVGLSQPLFNRFINGILRQMPLIRRLDKLSQQGLPDHEAITFLATSLSANNPLTPERAWKVLKDWFLHFFPEEYRIENRQEVLVKGRKLEL